MAVAAKVTIKALSIVIGIPVGVATKKVVEQVWTAARPEDPPRKATDTGVRWDDAIAWAALSAIGIVVADLVTRRSAEAAYRAITGNEPPRATDKAGKAAKKLAKASEKSKVTDD